MKRSLFTFIIILSFYSCKKSFFYEDPYNSGLSIFSSKNYNVCSAYINDSAWISEYNNPSIFSFTPNTSPIYLSIDTVNNPQSDTLNIVWYGGFKYSPPGFVPFQEHFYLTFAFPVKKNFTKTDFLNWNGKLFPSGTTSTTVLFSSLPYYYPNNYSQMTGSGKIYFVKISSQPNNGTSISGLFEGNIGDTILIKKGRFDFLLDPSQINLP